jgi:hypothetical protein
VHLKVRIPIEIQAINKIEYNSKYVTIHFGLIEEQAKKLENLTERKNITESEVLREIIDDYLFNLEKSLWLFSSKSSLLLILKGYPAQ